VQCGNPDGPHHHYAGVEEHSGTSDHPDGHGADRGPQPGMELLPIQQQAYQEEQQTQTRAWQIDDELWVDQHHDELASEQAALDAQLTELHRHKYALGME
jgi:hypothetical protein